jgi:dolichol-phosphate mannosyltransferase
MAPGRAADRGVVVVLPTFNERENLESAVGAILATLPNVSLLVVDDASPDGTGQIADNLAAQDSRVSVLHRPAKEGLGVAYRAGFEHALLEPETRILVQMDADLSHDAADLPRLVGAIDAGADLVLGTRYMRGGGTVGWPLARQLISRGGTLFARMVLLLPYRDLTGGFKAWRRDALEAVLERQSSAHGYSFQVETTWLAHRNGSRIVEIPIVFRERVAGQSKMTGSIVREAVGLVIGLRARALHERFRRPR